MPNRSIRDEMQGGITPRGMGSSLGAQRPINRGRPVIRPSPPALRGGLAGAQIGGTTRPRPPMVASVPPAGMAQQAPIPQATAPAPGQGPMAPVPGIASAPIAPNPVERPGLMNQAPPGQLAR